jgi:sugar lactone lactonase YvrE
MKNFFSLIIRSLRTMIFLSLWTVSSCSDDENNGIVPPEVTSISPAVGPKTTVVTITGTNFSGALTENEVTFNGKVATITGATSTQLTVAVPPAAGSGPVIVTTKGQSAAQQPEFTFQWMVSTLSGTTQGYVDGAAAKYYTPSGVSCDSDGNVYITDFNNHLIRKVNADGMASTLAGSAPGVDDGPLTTAKFWYPNGCAVDEQGNVYISEEAPPRVRKITSSGQVTTIAGGLTNGYVEGAGAAAQFKGPSGIAVDDQGTLYVADQHNHAIRKITPAGVVTTLAGGTLGNADGTGAAAQFYRPTGVVVDKQGNVFVADLFNHRIRKITSAGVVTTIAGSSAGYEDGSASTAKFSFPAGLALDKEGNLYVADSENHRIRKVTQAGVVTTFAGNTTQGISDGLATAAQFYVPREIDIDVAGNFYVADAANNRIRKID